MDMWNNGECSNEHKEAVMEWFKMIYGMGEPDSVLGKLATVTLHLSPF